jgi:hypothetical protein
MFFLDPAQSESRKIKEIFLKNGKLPAGKPIDAAQDTRCSICGCEIKKGEKCVIEEYAYSPPGNPLIVHIVTPQKPLRTAYRILCPNCAEDGVAERVKKEFKRNIGEAKDVLGRIFHCNEVCQNGGG